MIQRAILNGKIGVIDLDLFNDGRDTLGWLWGLTRNPNICQQTREEAAMIAIDLQKALEEAGLSRNEKGN